MLSTRLAYFAYDAIAATWSDSWKSPMSVRAESEAPPSSSSGQRFDHAFAKAPTAFSAPGPETTRPTPSRPLR